MVIPYKFHQDRSNGSWDMLFTLIICKQCSRKRTLRIFQIYKTWLFTFFETMYQKVIKSQFSPTPSKCIHIFRSVTFGNCVLCIKDWGWLSGFWNYKRTFFNVFLRFFSKSKKWLFMFIWAAAHVFREQCLQTYSINDTQNLTTINADKTQTISMSDRVFLSADGSESPTRHGNETDSQQLTIEERYHLRETQHLLLIIIIINIFV